jgi:hypothetical protein
MGYSSTAGGYTATAIGYSATANGQYSMALGFSSKATNASSLVWADRSYDDDTVSTNDYSVTMRAAGGYRLFTDPSRSSGVYLAPFGTAWSVISDRNAKKDFAPVDSVGILEKLAAMPVTQWHYKWEETNVTPHIGPVAQDFKAAFYPGSDDKSITTLEADGVALAAIQGLNKKVEDQAQEKDARIKALESKIAELQALVEKLATASK